MRVVFNMAVFLLTKKSLLAQLHKRAISKQYFKPIYFCSEFDMNQISVRVLIVKIFYSIERLSYEVIYWAT